MIKKRLSKNRSSSKRMLNSMSQKELISVKEDKELIAIKDENKDGFIVLKQESLYKPLLITFGIQLFVMLIVFPNIFDNLWPTIMSVVRNIVSWMALSAAGTLLPIPGGSPSDYRFLFSVVPVDTDLQILLIGLLLVSSDTLFAFFGYKFTATLRKIFMSRRNQKDEDKVNSRFKKYGNIAMFLGAATPLPFTLMVYTAGAMKLPRRGFLIATFAGRTLKYSLLALPFILFNITYADITDYGNGLLNDFLSGNLYAMHYIIIVITLGLVIWLTISIVNIIKSKIKKNKSRKII